MPLRANSVESNGAEMTIDYCVWWQYTGVFGSKQKSLERKRPEQKAFRESMRIFHAPRSFCWAAVQKKA